ncbi:GNAT family N-acetyltransferase [Vibrio furnissii]|uniref:GNAT family N-acetyltransferase n=1 Tax=Vibrio furnissii TaxID=29494 RepID=UPI001EEAEB31|nr:GNAT family N-acetyltransferase [Vibrio furnissii]MCG6216058.1 GNAT family N-acetyltransferase [Vibrio furnissii]
MNQPSKKASTSTFQSLTAVDMKRADVKVGGLKQFDCGNEVINKYVAKSLKNQAKAPGNGVIVVVDAEDKLVGFVTISAHSLTKDKLSSVEDYVGSTNMIPVVRLTMLGVDKKCQGHGLGSDLMAIAFERTVNIAENAGCVGLYLDADHYAVDFYTRLGFVALDNPDPITLVVPMFLHVNAIPK